MTARVPAANATDWSQLASSEGDALRQAGVQDIERVSAARLERSGDISVIERSDEPRVVDIDVADGVQTVRIRL